MKQKLLLSKTIAIATFLFVINAKAQTSLYKVDFGTATSIEAGYTLFGNETTGDDYRWLVGKAPEGAFATGVTTVSDLLTDAVYAEVEGIFQLDVVPGNYTVTVTLGDPRDGTNLSFYHDNNRVTIGDGTTSTLVADDVDFGLNSDPFVQTVTVTHTFDVATNAIEVTIDDDGVIGTDIKPHWVLQGLTVTQNSIASVEGFNAGGYQLFPNPVNDILNVVLPSGDGEVTILDVTGKVVLSASVSEDNSSVDVSALSSGIYIVNAGGRNGKFVKQ